MGWVLVAVQDTISRHAEGGPDASTSLEPNAPRLGPPESRTAAMVKTPKTSATLSLIHLSSSIVETCKPRQVYSRLVMLRNIFRERIVTSPRFLYEVRSLPLAGIVRPLGSLGAWLRQRVDWNQPGATLAAESWQRRRVGMLAGASLAFAMYDSPGFLLPRGRFRSLSDS